MRNVFCFIVSMSLSVGLLHAQFSRLHVKPIPGAMLGITTGGTNKVIGLNHDGTAAVISATTLDGTTNFTPLKFATSGQTRMTIFENGYVGIGVTGVPTAELTVGGKVHAREVKVNISAGTGPDYVFLSSYRLRPLSEVSLFINQHHHLPEVPEAASMEKDGVNVSEMNMLLLKKIEELTLYIIDQNEKLEAVNKQVQGLQEEVLKLKTR
jgi:hypothetical protein